MRFLAILPPLAMAIFALSQGVHVTQPKMLRLTNGFWEYTPIGWSCIPGGASLYFFFSTKDMCQFIKLCFGVPTFRLSLQIVWKVLYQAFTTANNGLKTMFETLVTWFKLFKHLKHYFFPIALQTFQSTYQNCVRMLKLNAKSPTDGWKVHKTQPFQP